MHVCHVLFSHCHSRELGDVLTAETVEIPGYIAGTWDIDPVHSHVASLASQ
jgi:hypothetical protein